MSGGQKPHRLLRLRNASMRWLSVPLYARAGGQMKAKEYVDGMSAYRDDRVSIELGRTLPRVNVHDFFRALDDLDWRQFDLMRQAIVATRGHYAAIHDHVTKNWQIILDPRDDDGGNVLVN